MLIFIKTIFFAVVLFGCTSLGIIISQRYVVRVEELRNLRMALQMFETKVRYAHDPIHDCFEQIYYNTNGKVGLIFKEAIDTLDNGKNLTAQEAWNLAVEKYNKKCFFTDEDKKAILSLGVCLGQSDVDGQIKQIQLVKYQIDDLIIKADAEKGKNQKLCRNLGLIGGIAFVIILF